jgi:hypothetical protein
MIALRPLLVTAAFGFVSLSAIRAAALPITDLFNTGVVTDDNDGLGAVLALPGTLDSHYVLTASPVLTDAATVLLNHPVWLANGPNSNWIGTSAGLGIGASDVPAGDYVYESTFTLPPGTDLSSVEITFLAASDNVLADLKLNGLTTGITQGGFTVFGGPFTIDSSNGTFVVGTNTLEWTTANFPIDIPPGSNPYGFRVDQIKGTYDLVPEPGSLFLVGLAALGLPIRRRHA